MGKKLDTPEGDFVIEVSHNGGTVLVLESHVLRPGYVVGFFYKSIRPATVPSRWIKVQMTDSTLKRWLSHGAQPPFNDGEFVPADPWSRFRWLPQPDPPWWKRILGAKNPDASKPEVSKTDIEKATEETLSRFRKLSIEVDGIEPMRG